MQWRTPITLAVLVVILLGAAYYGWQTVVDPVTDSGTATPTNTSQTTTSPGHLTCVRKTTYAAGAKVGSGSFKVNVYNASDVSGRAGDVSAELSVNGFQQGLAANAPAGVTATNVTILTSTPASPRVQLVKAQFKGPVKVLAGPDLATGVDVIVGPEFVGMATGAPDTLTVQKATTVCAHFAKPASGAH